jgi:hypothetical protein
MHRTDDYDENGVPGMVAAVAALALALEQNGVLARDAYCDALRRLWDAMPEGEAVGESGAVIEKMLGLLDGDDARDAGSTDGVKRPPVAETREDPVLWVA